MFNLTANPLYGFVIDTARMDSQESNSQVSPSPLALRELWTNHLINEQNQLNKAESPKHPLQNEFTTRNFFGH